MKNLSAIRKKSIISLVLFVQMFGISVSVLPQRALAETVYPPCPSVNGTSAPTGAAAHTYTFSPETCVWENAYYSWNPTTKLYSAKYDQTPMLNDTGTAWEHPQWDYIVSSGAYVKRIISVPVPIEVPSMPSAATPSESSTVTNPGQPGVSGAQSQTTGTSTINGTGSNSSNNILGNNSADTNINIINNTNIITTLDSTAVSGDAWVVQNTNGGSATSGSADVVAYYLNMIQSGWNPNSGALATFNANLHGTFNGDMLFDPSSISNSGASSTNNINNLNTSDLTVNIEDNANIVNNINLEAQTGDATVSQNTNAGNATTGDATAIANIINMINSSINSVHSFMGSINIHGDLNGDILLPQHILAQLFGTGFGSSNQITNSNNVDGNFEVNSNSEITNNLDLNAQSGNASVEANTNAGNATTGSALTNAQQQNYVGVNAKRKSGLLVYVNVLGRWVGLTLPGLFGISNTGSNSSNTISNENDANINGSISQDYSITNNINVDATTGDATVSMNTNAGNARSGNASSAVNMLNMIDSNLVFDDWFGVLFINVFGTWNGSFGVDTAAGGTKTPSVASGVETSDPPSQQQVPSAVLAASTKTSAQDKSRKFVAGTFSNSAGTTGPTTPQVLGISTNQEDLTALAKDTVQATSNKVAVWVIPISAILLAGIYVGRRQELALIQSVIRR